MLSSPPFEKNCRNVREDIEAEHGRRGALPLMEFAHLDADKQVI